MLQFIINILALWSFLGGILVGIPFVITKWRDTAEDGEAALALFLMGPVCWLIALAIWLGSWLPADSQPR